MGIEPTELVTGGTWQIGCPSATKGTISATPVWPVSKHLATTRSSIRRRCECSLPWQSHHPPRTDQNETLGAALGRDLTLHTFIQ